MSHDGWDSTIRASGYPYGYWGENVAYGYATADSVMQAWMQSAGHRANILNGSFAEIGIGIASGAPRSGIDGPAGTYVTDFGSRGTATTATTRPKKPTGRCATKASAHGLASRRTVKRCAARR